MAVTFDLSNLGQPRDMGATTRRFLVKYTGPALYVAGGDPGVAAAVGVGKVFAVLGLVMANSTPICLIGRYDAANDKIQWFDMTGAEASGDLSGYTAQLEIIGQ